MRFHALLVSGLAVAWTQAAALPSSDTPPPSDDASLALSDTIKANDDLDKRDFWYSASHGCISCMASCLATYGIRWWYQEYALRVFDVTAWGICASRCTLNWECVPASIGPGFNGGPDRAYFSETSTMFISMTEHGQILPD